MKLNYKRTILVGFAFFLIRVFWQAYDATIPVILTNKFGMSQTASGIVMALDNILALFMLPLFGSISDRHKGKSGRRTPFILFDRLCRRGRYRHTAYYIQQKSLSACRLLRCKTRHHPGYHNRNSGLCLLLQ